MDEDEKVRFKRWNIWTVESGTLKHVSKQTSIKQKWRKNYKCLALSITGLRTVISTHDISKIAIKCKLTTDIAIM